MQVVNNDTDNIDIGDKQAYDRLIDGKDIRFKTEINHEQRSVIGSIESSINHFGKKGIKLYVAQQFLFTFIDMGASLDRKSRLEVVDALKAKSDFLERQLITQEQQNNIR